MPRSRLPLHVTSISVSEARANAFRVLTAFTTNVRETLTEVNAKLPEEERDAEWSVCNDLIAQWSDLMMDELTKVLYWRSRQMANNTTLTTGALTALYASMQYAYQNTRDDGMVDMKIREYIRYLIAR